MSKPAGKIEETHGPLFRDWVLGQGEFSEENLAKSRASVGERLAQAYLARFEQEFWKQFSPHAPRPGSDPGGRAT